MARHADSRTPPTFVGVVRGTRAFIAVRRSGDEVLVYVCDGRSIFEWLRGRVRGNTIRLRGDLARLRVNARFSRRVVTGVVVRANGRQHEFTARLASKAPAGFHRASATAGVASGSARHQRVRGKRVIRGWIVLPDGRVRGGSTGLSPSCKAKLGEILTLQNTISTRDPTQVMNYFDKVSHFRAFCSNSLIAS